MTARVTWLGHSTVLAELGGVRLLTDPVLRDRLLHLRRVAAPVDPEHHARLDAVLISHLHHDHLDLPSLKQLDPSVLIAPAGSAGLAARHGFGELTELAAGESTEVGGVRISAVPAVHDGGRLPLGAKVDPLGYVLEAAGRRVYFAGDTDLYDGMAELGPLDLALVPVWGWGPDLGGGHLDPERAAAALALLEPRIAVPIHWGTLFPIGRRDPTHRLTDPPHEFARAAAKAAPGVEVRLLAPGGSLEL